VHPMWRHRVACLKGQVWGIGWPFVQVILEQVRTGWVKPAQLSKAAKRVLRGQAEDGRQTIRKRIEIGKNQSEVKSAAFSAHSDVCAAGV
jgi:hypothetical protein